MKKNYITTIITIIAIIATASTSFAQVGWWPFNGNANDESGNGNHGTVMGAELTTDRFGNENSAYYFDGLASYITIPSSSSLESPTSHLSMTAWVNASGMSLVGDSFAPILTKGNSGSNVFMYRFFLYSNGTWFSAGINSWSANVSGAGGIALDEWLMLSAVFDSTTAYLYLNDSLVHTQLYLTNITNNTMPLEIGRDMPGYTEIFYGKIDDVWIWSRALHSSEIDSLYNKTNPSGIEDLAERTRFSIYPNPTNDVVNIVGIINENIIVTNLMGSTVEVLKGANTIDMSTYNKGLYFIQLINDSGHIVYSGKVIRK